MTTYEEAIDQLGGAIGADLKPDQNNTCLIQLKTGEEVYAEPDKSGKNLLFGMMIERIAPGKGRERLFQGALIANGRPAPRPGNLAYSRKADQLVLYKLVPLERLKGPEVAEHLKTFAEYGREWREATRTGRLP